MRRHVHTPSGPSTLLRPLRADKARWLAVATVAALTLLGPLAARAAHPWASTAPQVIAAAQHAVQLGRAPVTDFAFATPTHRPARHKLIVGITCINVTGCLDPILGAQEAGKALGWKMKIIDGKGDPTTWNAAVLNAITIHADGIVVSAVPSFLIGDALQKARAAKIPVVSFYNPTVKNDGFYGHVTPDERAQGRLVADWVIADSKGMAHVIFIGANEHMDLLYRYEGFKSEFARCAGCKLDAYVPTTAATFYTRLAGATAAALEQHPDTTYAVGATDDFIRPMVQGIRQLGRTGRVKVAGFDGTDEGMGFIHSGDETATAAEPLYFSGWLMTDVLVHAFAGQPPHDPAFVPTKLLDKGNSPAKGLWDGDFDYKSKFLKLWGVK